MGTFTQADYDALYSALLANTAPEFLDLSDRGINDNFVRYIFNTLRYNTSVKRVNLANNIITNRGINYIYIYLTTNNSPIETDLVEIDLSGNSRVTDNDKLALIQEQVLNNIVTTVTSTTLTETLSTLTSTTTTSILNAITAAITVDQTLPPSTEPNPLVTTTIPEEVSQYLTDYSNITAAEESTVTTLSTVTYASAVTLMTTSSEYSTQADLSTQNSSYSNHSYQVYKVDSSDPSKDLPHWILSLIVIGCMLVAIGTFWYCKRRSANNKQDPLPLSRVSPHKSNTITNIHNPLYHSSHTITPLNSEGNFGDTATSESPYYTAPNTAEAQRILLSRVNPQHAHYEYAAAGLNMDESPYYTAPNTAEAQRILLSRVNPQHAHYEYASAWLNKGEETYYSAPNVTDAAGSDHANAGQAIIYAVPLVDENQVETFDGFNQPGAEANA